MAETLRVLFDAQTIQARVAQLGAAVRADAGAAPVTLIGVLKGSFVFMADLARAIPGEVRVEFLGVASYHGGTTSSGAVQITHDLRRDIAGQHCILVEDIVDTGLTIDFLKRVLAVREPHSLRVAALLDKPANRTVPVTVDYVGFTIADAFVVGYGLDLAERHRNLPYVATCEP